MKDASRRAQRFSFHVPVRYRARGGEWHEGRMENISRSGVLFHVAAAPDLDTEVEIAFVLPLPVTAPRIVCRGRVVRMVPAGNGTAGARVAATIASYRFIRGAAA